MGFTGIILGNKMNNNKTLYSVIYGFLTYTASQLFVLALIFIYGLFDKDVMNLFHTTDIVSVDMIKTIIAIACISYLFVIVVVYFINNKLFKKGVNVD